MPASQCGEGQEGCLYHTDCYTGATFDKKNPSTIRIIKLLFTLLGYICSKSNPARPYCTELDECTSQRSADVDLVAAYCASESYCYNTVGSFYCSCNSGYHNFVPYSGCTDFNECSNNPSICGPYTVCTNTVGSYTCACESGFEDFQVPTGTLSPLCMLVSVPYVFTSDTSVYLKPGSTFGVFLVVHKGFDTCIKICSSVF